MKYIFIIIISKDEITANIYASESWIACSLLPLTLPSSLLSVEATRDKERAIEEEIRTSKKSPLEPSISSTVEIYTLKTLPATTVNMLNNELTISSLCNP